MLVYCDLDDVIVDFLGGALDVYGWTRQKFNARRQIGYWGIYTGMGITHEEFWSHPGLQRARFWQELKPLPWAQDLYRLLSRTEAWGIASAVPDAGGDTDLAAIVGKATWMTDRLLPKVIKNSHIVYDKTQLARPGTLLIDDRRENVERFEAAGGKGIVFPTLGNELFQMADDPVRYVKRMLEHYSCI